MTSNNMTTEQVWLDYKGKLSAFILSRVNNREEANDIVQDVFIKVHLNLPALKEQARLSSWLYQITRNSIQDHFRKKRFLPDVDTLDVIDEKDASGFDDLQLCMVPFMNKLPGKYREALILSDFNKIGQMNLAQQLKISYSGAKSRVQRARQLLRSYFTECCDITPDKYGNIVSYIPKRTCACNG